MAKTLKKCFVLSQKQKKHCFIDLNWLCICRVIYAYVTTNIYYSI